MKQYGKDTPLIYKKLFFYFFFAFIFIFQKVNYFCRNENAMKDKENYKVIGVQVSEETHRIIKEASAYFSEKEGRFISIRELIHRYVHGQLQKEIQSSQSK